MKLHSFGSLYRRFRGRRRVRSDDLGQFFGTLQFTLLDGANNPLTAVGVPPATPGREFTVVGKISNSSTIGVAMVALPTNPAPANITVKAWDFSGNQIGSTENVVLNQGQHSASFIHEAPFNVPRSANTQVSVTISSDQPIVVLALGDEEPGFKIFGTPTLPGRIPNPNIAKQSVNTGGRQSR